MSAATTVASRRDGRTEPVLEKSEVVYPIQKNAHLSTGLDEGFIDFSPGGYLCISKMALEHKFANEVELCSKLHLMR